jgi:hypothetical protein
MLQVSPQSGQHVEVTVKNEYVTEDEGSTKGADIKMEELHYDRQEVIKMQADALAKYNKEAQANKEKTLSAKLELIKPCSVILERLKVPTRLRGTSLLSCKRPNLVTVLVYHITGIATIWTT